jgi:hypothetical protein
MPISSGWRLLGWPFCPLLPLPVPLIACTGNSTLVYWLILASCRLSELCGCRWLPPGPYPLLPPLRLLHRTPLHPFRILGHQIRKFYRIFRIRPPPPQKRTRSLPFTFWTPPCLLHQQLPLQTPPDPIRIHRSFFRIRVLLLRIQHLSLQLLLFTLRDNPCLPRWAGRTSPLHTHLPPPSVQPCPPWPPAAFGAATQPSCPAFSSYSSCSPSPCSSPSSSLFTPSCSSGPGPPPSSGGCGLVGPGGQAGHHLFLPALREEGGLSPLPSPTLHQPSP